MLAEEVKDIELRQYQQELINNIKRSINSGKRSVCAVLGCGGGKSVIEAAIAKSANDKGNRVLFLVHRSELCEQINNTFALCGVNPMLTQVGMVQTVTRRLAETPEPQIIITDECHHSLARTYLNIYYYFPDAVRIGFTATPVRMGTGGLGKVFDDLIESVSTKWLIDNHYLSPYKYYSYKLIDRSGFHIKRGEFDISEVVETMEKPKIYGDTVLNYQKIANGKKTIVYCASIESSRMTAKEFQENGYKSAHLDGTTPTKERDRIVEAFRNGEIDILCNVDLFGEGFDVPDCECVILLRPTKSLTLHIQQSMRSMRYKPDKQAIIIDHVGNVFEHGLPDDVREWTLTAKKTKAQNTVKVRECPECYAVYPANSDSCPVCGYTPPVSESDRREIEKVVNVELEELSPEELRQMNLREKPYSYSQELRTFEEMDEFRQARGYQFVWTLYQCKHLGIPIPPRYHNIMRKLT